MMKKLCVVIPIFRKKITDKEKISLLSIKKNCGYADVIFVAPYDLDGSIYISFLPGAEVRRFKKSFFKNVNSYSKMMMSYKFYEKFSDYEYMLIIQTDAVLLKKIDESFSTFYDFDYIGAPWMKPISATCVCFRGVSFVARFLHPRDCYIGNGGFSLRNISACIMLLKKKKIFSRVWNTGEDIFFSYHGMDSDIRFRMPPVEVGRRFAIERELDEKYIPYGIHAWDKLPSESIPVIPKNV